MVEQVEELVRDVESAYASQDLERVMALFHPDIVFYWNGELRGRGLADLRRWHESAFATAGEYRIRKTLRAAGGDTIAVEWTDSWVDRVSGDRRVGYGAEFWTMNGTRVQRWHAYWRGYGASDPGATRLDSDAM